MFSPELDDIDEQTYACTMDIFFVFIIYIILNI